MTLFWVDLGHVKQHTTQPSETGRNVRHVMPSETTSGGCLHYTWLVDIFFTIQGSALQCAWLARLLHPFTRQCFLKSRASP